MRCLQLESGAAGDVRSADGQGEDRLWNGQCARVSGPRLFGPKYLESVEKLIHHLNRNNR